MLASLGLSSTQIELLRSVALQLSEVQGIEAVVLGGSYAEYYFGDKGSLEAIDLFNRQPHRFSARLQGVLALPTANPRELESAVHEMQVLWKEVVDLTEGGYAPKFDLAR